MTMREKVVLELSKHVAGDIPTSLIDTVEALLKGVASERDKVWVRACAYYTCQSTSDFVAKVGADIMDTAMGWK